MMKIYEEYTLQEVADSLSFKDKNLSDFLMETTIIPRLKDPDCVFGAWMPLLLALMLRFTPLQILKLQVISMNNAHVAYTILRAWQMSIITTNQLIEWIDRNSQPMSWEMIWSKMYRELPRFLLPPQPKDVPHE